MSQFQPTNPWQQQPPQQSNQYTQWGVASQPLPPQQPPYQQPQYYEQPPQPYYQPPIQPTSQPPKKKSRRNLWIVLGVILAIIIISSAAAAAGGGSQNTTNTTSQPTQAPTTIPTQELPTQELPTQAPKPNPTAKPSPTYPQFGDGTYQVGKDIQSGTYRTRVGSPGCYYARLRGFGGTIDDTIANNNTDAPTIVTIAATDKGFTSQNCGTWTKDLSQITANKTTFGDGMYIVGTDIMPGIYRNTGAQGCYFARLSGFGNTTDDIIANDNVDNPTIVTISPSDKGFESTGCGTWTKH